MKATAKACALLLMREDGALLCSIIEAVQVGPGRGDLPPSLQGELLFLT